MNPLTVAAIGIAAGAAFPTLWLAIRRQRTTTAAYWAGIAVGREATRHHARQLAEQYDDLPARDLVALLDLDAAITAHDQPQETTR